jgi:hypothetical protein
MMYVSLFLGKMSLTSASVMGTFHYQSVSVPCSLISTKKVYIERDSKGSDAEPIGLDSYFAEIPVWNGRESKLDFEKNGFILTDHSYHHIDYYDEDAVVTKYYQDICDFVKLKTGAKVVYAFDHNIRSSDVNSWMNKETNANVPNRAVGSKVQSPASIVHGDFTLTSAPLRMNLLTQPPRINDTWKKQTNKALIDPEKFIDLKRSTSKYAFINVWRNIDTEPVIDMPLALCDASTTTKDDLIAFEVRYADRVGENYLSRYSPKHKWFYFPQMTRDECIIFKVWDSLGAEFLKQNIACDDQNQFPSCFCLHSAFRDPTAPSECRKRQSIEIRTIAFF